MSSVNLRPAVFLDRDGTINVEKDYLIDPAEFDFIPGVPAALKKLQDAGYLLVVVSNQSGVARGYFSEEQVDKLHQHMVAMLTEAGVSLDGIYFCPHHPSAGLGDYLQNCNCRKGKPGMLQRAAVELDIDLQKSYMVGDKVADIQAGHAVGCKTILVCTGYGQNFVRDAMQYGAEIVADLPDAVKKILVDGS
ncbi:D-glycero-beta-D-manno-heptose 1,7-bisphosphate 7-phosphatase [Deltaproteobacteria bacterium]|nr:D-glycero-beta-D-manno-heptose 1,7-bisphosphate 7-phosphatase [Deltaproteobacteria bacterium]